MIKQKIKPIYHWLRRRIRYYLFADNFEMEAARWFRDKGESTLRLNYVLDDSSVVFDCGGYQGDWASEIYERYKSSIYVFEPVSQFCESIKSRFSGNDKIHVYCFGLSNSTASGEMVLQQNSSSLYKSSGELQTIHLVDIREFLADLGIRRIDLIKINIEGGEYDLLDCILSSGLAGIISDFQIQFHNFVPGAKARRDNIRERLSETHYLTYDYEFIWENWRKRDSNY